MEKKRIVVAVSGASGSPLALALLRLLRSAPSREAGCETHLIVSSAARQVLERGGEGVAFADLRALADAEYSPDDFAAPMSSGSWLHAGMIVCPCSMASLAAIATGCGSNLAHRAADVCLKERRPLVLVTRETPLSRVHIANMLAAAQAGAVIMPPMPAWYAGARTLESAAEHFCLRVLDQLGFRLDGEGRWQGG